MKKKYRNKLPKGAEVKGYIAHVDNGEIVVEVELKDRFQPKDGDFVTYESSEKATFVYKKGKFDDFCGCYWGEKADVSNLCKNKCPLYDRGSECWESKIYCRYATDEEKSALILRLEKEYHKRWNAEKKCLEDIRWRTAVFEEFCYVDSHGDVCHRTDDLDDCSNNFYDIGNYFRTEEAAQKVADQIINIFKNSKAE